MDRRRRRLRIGQLVIAEVALVGVVVASVGPAWLLLGVAAAATAVFVATFGRSGGRWWYEAVASHRRFARRRRRAAADVVAATLAARTPSVLVWLRTLAPELTMRPVISADTVVGVGADGTGWFGALAVEPDAPGLAEVATLIEAGGDRVALSHAQVVRHGPRTWVALRLSPVDAVEAERSGGLAGVEAGVAAGVVRGVRLLRNHGYEAVALDPDGLLAALVAANGLDAAPQEHWSAWRSGTLAHTTYAASAWPPEPLLAAPGLWAATASFARGAAAGGAGVGGILIRVAAEPDALGQACREVARQAARVGVRLRRLDGDQAPAAYACGPSGMPADGLGAGHGHLPRGRDASVRSLGSVPRDR
jgi:hypothetical protein